MGGPKSYMIAGENGGHYLRNGRFVKLRITKARTRVRVAFCGDVLCSAQAGGA